MDFEFPYWAWSGREPSEAAQKFERAAKEMAAQHCGRPITLTFKSKDKDENNSADGDKVGDNDANMRHVAEKHKQITINSYILVRHSPVFHAMLNEDRFLESRSNSINLPEEEFDFFDRIYDFLIESPASLDLEKYPNRFDIMVMAYFKKYQMLPSLARGVALFKKKFYDRVKRCSSEPNNSNPKAAWLKLIDAIYSDLEEVNKFQLEELEWLILTQLPGVFDKALSIFGSGSKWKLIRRLEKRSLPEITKQRVLAVL